MVTWDYVAGYFDGEGHAGIFARSGSRGSARIGFCNSHRGSLEQIRRFLNAGRIVTRKGTNKPVYTLDINRVEELQRILPEMIARCIVKREALERVRDHVAGRTAGRRGVMDGVDPGEVITMYERGAALTTLALAFETTPDTIRAFLRKHGGTVRTKGEGLRVAARKNGRYRVASAGPEEIRRLYWEEGLGHRKIAERLGVSHCSVKSYMQRHGIPIRTVSEAYALREKAR